MKILEQPPEKSGPDGPVVRQAGGPVQGWQESSRGPLTVVALST